MQSGLESAVVLASFPQTVFQDQLVLHKKQILQILKKKEILQILKKKKLILQILKKKKRILQILKKKTDFTNLEKSEFWLGSADSGPFLTRSLVPNYFLLLIFPCASSAIETRVKAREAAPPPRAPPLPACRRRHLHSSRPTGVQPLGKLDMGVDGAGVR